MTCGTVIKLQHIGTNFHLHSHEVAYGSGSGQQSVTASSSGDDAGSYWVVKGPEVWLPTSLLSWHCRCSAGRRSCMRSRPSCKLLSWWHEMLNG